MQPSVLTPTVDRLDPHVIASLGNYTLLQLDDNRFEVHGPDDRCPTDWIRRHLTDGDWYTEWTGHGDIFVCLITS